jgi:hypothetical protein
MIARDLVESMLYSPRNLRRFDRLPLKDRQQRYYDILCKTCSCGVPRSVPMNINSATTFHGDRNKGDEMSFPIYTTNPSADGRIAGDLVRSCWIPLYVNRSSVIQSDSISEKSVTNLSNHINDRMHHQLDARSCIEKLAMVTIPLNCASSFECRVPWISELVRMTLFLLRNNHIPDEKWGFCQYWPNINPNVLERVKKWALFKTWAECETGLPQYENKFFQLQFHSLHVVITCISTDRFYSSEMRQIAMATGKSCCKIYINTETIVAHKKWTAIAFPQKSVLAADRHSSLQESNNIIPN